MPTLIRHSKVTCKPVRLRCSIEVAYQAADADHPSLGSESSPLKKESSPAYARSDWPRAAKAPIGRASPEENADRAVPILTTVNRAVVRLWRSRRLKRFMRCQYPREPTLLESKLVGSKRRQPESTWPKRATLTVKACKFQEDRGKLRASIASLQQLPAVLDRKKTASRRVPCPDPGRAAGKGDSAPRMEEAESRKSNAPT